MSKSYLNKVELKDGQILLFHRPNSKRPIYHMRIHVRGMKDARGGKVTYIQESTGETDLEEAKRVALDKFDDLRLRVRAKQSVVSVSFRAVYEIWWADKAARLDAHFKDRKRTGRNARKAWYEKYSERYWLPYFGAYKVEDLTHSIVQGYWDWRRTYWTRATEAERKSYPNYALSPSKKTLDMEQSALREVFGWANSMKIISYQPVIQNPFARKGIAPKRRPSFDEDEFLKLQLYMEEWIEGRGVNDKKVNSAHKYNRKLLRIYIHWLAYTGMRTGEVLKLKHKDITTVLLDDRRIGLSIQVAEDTKTGSRIATSTADLYDHYEDLKELTGHADASDWLFCNAKGKQVTGFFKTFSELLNDVGLLYDDKGEKRTAYSFRHYYAERMFAELGHTHAVLDMLAVNMGTGRDYLESYYIRRGMIDNTDALIRTRHKKASAVLDEDEIDGVELLADDWDEEA